jgi:hypothetical protein
VQKREAQNVLLGDLESIRSLLEPDAARSTRRDAQDAAEEDIPTLDDVVDSDALHVAEEPIDPPSREEPSAARVSASREPSAARVSASREPSATRVSASREPSATRVSASREPSAARVSASREPSATRVSARGELSIGPTPRGLPDEAFDALLGDEWRDQADRILEDARARLDDSAQRWSTQDANAFMTSLQARLNEVVRGWLAEVVRRELEDLRETLTAAIEIEIDAFSLRMKDLTDDAE